MTDALGFRSSRKALKLRRIYERVTLMTDELR